MIRHLFFTRIFEGRSSPVQRQTTLQKALRQSIMDVRPSLSVNKARYSISKPTLIPKRPGRDSLRQLRGGRPCSGAKDRGILRNSAYPKHGLSQQLESIDSV